MATQLNHLPSLNAKLDEVSREIGSQIPAESKQLLSDFIEELRESGMVENALNKGDRIRHFELPNAVGSLVSSMDLLAKGPLVISFYRGAWCPYCNMHLQMLQMALPEIHDRGAQLVAISPQTPDNSLTLAERHELEFEVLSDQGNEVARDFGLVFSLSEPVKEFFRVAGFDLPEYNGDERWELPIPATYVVDQDGIVVSHIDPDWSRRMEPREIVEALDELR
jgi:peroxiredoxin